MEPPAAAPGASGDHNEETIPSKRTQLPETSQDAPTTQPQIPTVTPGATGENGEETIRPKRTPLPGIKSHYPVQSPSLGHEASICSCGIEFTQEVGLDHHCKSYRGTRPKFPCIFCTRRCGAHSFQRPQNLFRHLRDHHGLQDRDIAERLYALQGTVARTNLFCPHPRCPSRRNAKFKRPFTRRDYFAHLKAVHEVTPFPCPVPHCLTVGRKGYITARGLAGHLATWHSDAPQYLEKFRREVERKRYTCGGCKKGFYDLSEFRIHSQLAHESDDTVYRWPVC
ncbi:hypothetical protein F5Y04DRAFT_293159 [Hypomontagnella monticulosa]|nr:hypothetical protein F5Y04DRAFT_293159 [Hypomontagnella monticulosa]